MDDLTPEDILAHYGVKGMRWGVRKKEDGGDNQSSAKESVGFEPLSSAARDAELKALYKSIPEPKLSTAQQARNIAISEKKFLAKADIDPDSGAITEVSEKKFWTPTGKQVAYGVAGAAVIGLIAYGGYKAYNGGFGPAPAPGESISAEHYNFLSGRSKLMSWGSGYIKPSSYDRPEMVLPAGHTFHRITTSTESSFRLGTYATTDIDDYNRYLTAFRGEKGASAALRHMTFNATEEIRIPKLTDTLETMRETIAMMEERTVTPAEALSRYKSMSGGSWNDSTSEIFFDNLKKKGFGAIIDEMDAGVIGEKPVVVFSKALTEKVGELITPDQISAAESALTEIANRK